MVDTKIFEDGHLLQGASVTHTSMVEEFLFLEMTKDLSLISCSVLDAWMPTNLRHEPIKQGYQHMLYSKQSLFPNHLMIIITHSYLFMLFSSALAKSILIIKLL